MGFGPSEPVEHGEPSRHIVDAPTTPRTASEYAKRREQSATARAVPSDGFQRVIGTAGIIPAAGHGPIGGEMTLVPAYPAHHRLAARHHRPCSTLSATLAKPDATCSSNERKDAWEAVGLARSTISHPAGRRSSYRRARTRKRRLTVLRATAFPTDLDTARPSLRSSGETSPRVYESSRTI